MPSGAPPHPVLVRILHFKDQDTILRAARDLPDLKIDNGKISIFPNFSAEVQQHRQQFFEIKKCLRVLRDALSGPTAGGGTNWFPVFFLIT